MIRPRSSPATVVCTSVLPPVMYSSITVPSAARTTRNGPCDDSEASTSWATPMSAASRTSWRSRTRRRRVEASAPVTAPSPSIDVSRAYPDEPLRNTVSVYEARTVAMLTPVMATKPMSTTGQRMVGVRRT